VKERARERNDGRAERYPHPPGSLYEYQKKGVIGEGVCMSIKIKGIEREGQI
jgi:hypothetical protein